MSANHHTTIAGTLLASATSIIMSYSEDVLRSAICAIVGGTVGYFVSRYLKKRYP